MRSQTVSEDMLNVTTSEITHRRARLGWSLAQLCREAQVAYHPVWEALAGRQGLEAWTEAAIVAALNAGEDQVLDSLISERPGRHPGVPVTAQEREAEKDRVILTFLRSIFITLPTEAAAVASPTHRIGA